MKNKILDFKAFLNECECEAKKTAEIIHEEIEGGGERDKNECTITVVARDGEGTLKKLLNAIAAAGNGGHSFSIVVDPEGDNGGETFGWDGDGNDRIVSVTDDSEGYEEGEEEDEDEVSEAKVDDNHEKDLDKFATTEQEKDPVDELNEKRAGSEADGSFPITDLESLKKAIHAYGRSKDKAKTKAHIRSKVKSLGLAKHVSEEWK